MWHACECQRARGRTQAVAQIFRVYGRAEGAKVRLAVSMAISLKYMRESLSQAYRTVNENKLNGIRAELAFYRYVSSLGFADRLSPGGWIMRPKEVLNFGRDAVAVFPEEIDPDVDMPVG